MRSNPDPNRRPGKGPEPARLIYNHQVSRKDLNESFSYESTRDACVVASNCGGRRRRHCGLWMWKHLSPGGDPDNPTGPAAQPQSLAVVVSSTSTTAPGLVTIVDY